MKNLFETENDITYILLNRDLKAKIDTKNIIKVNEAISGRWAVIPNGAGKPYVRHFIKSEKRYVYLHRIISDRPDGLVVDHLDGDPLNNLESNLKRSSHRENSLNRQGCNKNNKSTGVRGVTICNNKFRARLGQKQIGTFENINDAILALEMAREINSV